MAEGIFTRLPVLTGKGRPRREDLRRGELLCGHCPAKCCRYFALPIDTPTEWQDFDYIRWYLLHERAAVFVEEGDWYLLVNNRCKHLGEDNRCDVYGTRPQICRDYATDDCEYEDDWVYDHYWETPEQVAEYAEAILGPRKGQGRRGARPSRQWAVGGNGECRSPNDEAMTKPE
jgi:Fe-S-cluster containining protein